MPDSNELDEILNEIKNKSAKESDNSKDKQVEFKLEDQPDKQAEKSPLPEAEKPAAFHLTAAPGEEEIINEEKAVKHMSGNSDKKGSKKPIIIAIIVVLVVAVVVAVVFLVKGGNKEQKDTTASTAPPQTVSQEVTDAVSAAVNPLTGEADYNESAVGKRPIACVVENAYAARPQWGIDDEKNPPDIILEGEVEGGETRMLWFYSDYTSVPDKIGPMRSARPPYIKFSELFDAIFIHWGQSQTKKGTAYIGANTVFRVDNVDHINAMTHNGSLFSRDSSRRVSTEHTGVLNGKLIAKAIKAKEFRTSINEANYTRFSFNEEDKAVSDTACSSLALTFSKRTATRSWTYNESDKMYHCKDYSSNLGSSDVARKNLLVLFDDTEYISKANYKNSGSAEIYCNYKLSGGKGKLATDGSVIDITWSVQNGKLAVQDAQGNDVKFNVGTTWIGYGSTNNGGSVTV